MAQSACYVHALVSIYPSILCSTPPVQVSTNKIQGIMGGCGWSVAYNHIKVCRLAPFPPQRISTLKACWADMPKYAGENIEDLHSSNHNKF